MVQSLSGVNWLVYGVGPVHFLRVCDGKRLEVLHYVYSLVALAAMLREFSHPIEATD